MGGTIGFHSTPIKERSIAGSKEGACSGPVWKTETIQCSLGLSDAIRDPAMSLFLSVTFHSQASVPSLSTHHVDTTGQRESFGLDDVPPRIVIVEVKVGGS